MFEQAQKIIDKAQKIVIVQAENPDGDSIGSSIALDEILSALGKDVSLYCPVDVPKYLRYIRGWDTIDSQFNTHADLAIIVDTAADVLLTKVLDTPGVRHFLETHPVLVIDHHTTASNLSFDHTMLSQDAVASSEVIYDLAAASGWTVNQTAAESMLVAIMSDSLGLTTQNVTAHTYEVCAGLAAAGAQNSVIEERRREFMKKAPEILEYKGQLISRIEYFLDGQLALVHIPWDEIQAYSDQYNPSMLVLDEMRLVEGVQVGVAIKTYPDGRLTGKLRSNAPVSEQIAGFFGGGGHKYAAGFRVYENYDTILKELIEAADKALTEYDNTDKPTQYTF